MEIIMIKIVVFSIFKTLLVATAKLRIWEIEAGIIQARLV